MDADVLRLRLDLAYDGTDFSGWAAQPGRRTVQGVLAEALGRVLRLPEPPLLTVAGRTDAGVHAEGQAAHLDVPAEVWAGVAADRVLWSLAGVLPPDVRVRGLAAAPGRVRRPVLRALAPVLLPRLRLTWRRRPATPPRHALAPASAAGGTDERRGRPAARRA